MFCGFVAEMGPRLRIAEMRKHYVAVMALFLSLSTASLSAQTDKKISVSLIYEAIAATNATLWLTEDAKLFEKYGLDTKVVHARGAVPVQVSSAVRLNSAPSAAPRRLPPCSPEAISFSSRPKATSR